MRTRRHGGAVLAACLVLAGCSTAQPERPAASPAPTQDPTSALRERCGSAVPDDADLEALTLPGRTGGEVEAARIGPPTNRTVAVLLPQIGGMCGWGRWATAAAREVGITSLLVDPCGYGDSVCTDEQDDDPLHEVAPAIEHARDEMGAGRVVLLGTSMGGSLTVIAVAAGADADAWADVSGPPAWDGVALRPLAGRLTRDGLVVMAPSDGRAIFRSARALARAGGVPFVAGRSGHGWDLLVNPVSGSVTRIGRELMAHAVGPTGA